MKIEKASHFLNWFFITWLLFLFILNIFLRDYSSAAWVAVVSMYFFFFLQAEKRANKWRDRTFELLKILRKVDEAIDKAYRDVEKQKTKETANDLQKKI